MEGRQHPKRFHIFLSELHIVGNSK